MGRERTYLTVLVVTPNEAVRQQICVFLTSTGVRVLEAGNVTETRAAVNEYRGEIHVCMVEGEPGFAKAVLARARKVHPFAKALVMTSHPECVMQKLKGTADLAFIEKPFAWRTLSLYVAKCIDANLRARHEMLMQWSSDLIDECTRRAA